MSVRQHLDVGSLFHSSGKKKIRRKNGFRNTFLDFFLFHSIVAALLNVMKNLLLLSLLLFSFFPVSFLEIFLSSRPKLSHTPTQLGTRMDVDSIVVQRLRSISRSNEISFTLDRDSTHTVVVSAQDTQEKIFFFFFRHTKRRMCENDFKHRLLKIRG